MTDPDLWPRVLTALSHRRSLDGEQAAEAMHAVMQGDATEAQIGAFLLALRTKGETVEEIEGFARAMLDFAVPVRAPEPVIDTCGTGGDRAGTFNISTIAALVVAGAGVPVAKHGNRAASSSCGSADLLEELGVKIDLDGAGVERCLAGGRDRVHVRAELPPGDGARAPVRAELRVPTVFNFLGPLTNPARPLCAGRGRVRRAHAAADGGGSRPTRDARDAVPRRGRARRADDDRPVRGL